MGEWNYLDLTATENWNPWLAWDKYLMGSGNRSFLACGEGAGQREDRWISVALFQVSDVAYIIFPDMIYPWLTRNVW